MIAGIYWGIAGAAYVAQLYLLRDQGKKMFVLAAIGAALWGPEVIAAAALAGACLAVDLCETREPK